MVKYIRNGFHNTDHSWGCYPGHLIVSRMKEEVAGRPVDEKDDEEDGTRNQEQQLDPVLLLEEGLGKAPDGFGRLVKF